MAVDSREKCILLSAPPDDFLTSGLTLDTIKFLEDVTKKGESSLIL
jgi:hypothetical protein